MKTLQEVFTLAIEERFFGRYNRFMCCALNDMASSGVITSGDYYRAAKAIKGYLGGHHTLTGLLIAERLMVGIQTNTTTDHDFAVCLKVYTSWKSRRRIIAAYIKKELKNVA